ncbi:redoxin family protein [Natronolimnobius sp. AArcel1]|uniref:TlpA family protein disulfide reductase n=1 Tax=Natronolimnobius sp. AArcel1 TaxID=1679093 RepID=UPI0013EA078F|nr:TlpA family protein disulfide reductase [Natronolimnobius sp. AArcel1]NGM71526.1 redoxin family protein [Natronolimnobius sp. AArcel1]
MRRRDILAGIGSAGVVAGAGAVAIYGLPSVDDLTGEDDGYADDPLEIETVDAPGSEAGTVQIPDPEKITFIDIFGTWCPPCIEQMPALGEASDRIGDGDEIQFLSVTNESIGENRAITMDELLEWWREHDGDWTLGLDPSAELTERYLQGDYPSAVAIDTAGRVQWGDSGIKTADELVDGIEQAFEADNAVDMTGE